MTKKSILYPEKRPDIYGDMTADSASGVEKRFTSPTGHPEKHPVLGIEAINAYFNVNLPHCDSLGNPFIPVDLTRSNGIHSACFVKVKYSSQQMDVHVDVDHASNENSATIDLIEKLKSTGEKSLVTLSDENEMTNIRTHITEGYVEFETYIGLDVSAINDLLLCDTNQVIHKLLSNGGYRGDLRSLDVFTLLKLEEKISPWEISTYSKTLHIHAFKHHDNELLIVATNPEIYCGEDLIPMRNNRIGVKPEPYNGDPNTTIECCCDVEIGFRSWTIRFKE